MSEAPHPEIRLLDKPRRITPCGLKIAIALLGRRSFPDPAELQAAMHLLDEDAQAGRVRSDTRGAPDPPAALW